MPLDHSIESRRNYDRQHPGRTLPADLQITSYRKIARKVINPLRRLVSSKKESRPSIPPESTKDEVIVLPRRPLTPPLSQNPSSQLQSPLFRLPSELRNQVYEHVLGRSNVHLELRHGYRIMRHTRCACDSCPGAVKYFDRSLRTLERKWVCNTALYDYGGAIVSPGLLQTCRAIYAESIEFLYSSNIFTFPSFTILKQFTSNISPLRLKSVRVVHLDLAVLALATIEGSHQVTWETLQRFTGLCELEIRIHQSFCPNGWEPQFWLDRLREEVLGIEKSPRTKLYLAECVDILDWMCQEPFEACRISDWEWARVRSPSDMWSIWQ